MVIPGGGADVREKMSGGRDRRRLGASFAPSLVCQRLSSGAVVVTPTAAGLLPITRRR